MDNLIFVINTGSTSTKVALYNNEKPVFVETIRHPDTELKQFKDVNAQKDYREKMILDFLKEKKIELNSLKAISARGGLLRPLESGTYEVNEKMIKDLIEAKRGLHASHLSAQIGFSIAKSIGIKCYIVDPISIDEYDKLARYSGFKEIERISLTHALNVKAVYRRFIEENNLDYYNHNSIIVHLGTGITVALQKNGRMIDAINPSEEGTFALDRSGGLPVLQSVKYALNNNLTYKEFERKIFGNGGMYSYLGTKDFFKIEKDYLSGDEKTIEIVDAMAYQTAKDVGALSTVVFGKLDSILITGGMAHAKFFVELIKERIKFLAPIYCYPGEDEMESLAQGVYRILIGKDKAKEY